MVSIFDLHCEEFVEVIDSECVRRLITDGKGYKWGHIGARIKEARKKVGERVGVNEHLVDLAFCCEVSTDWLLGRESVDVEVLDEAEVSFRAEHFGIPEEMVVFSAAAADGVICRRLSRAGRIEDTGVEDAWR